MAINEKWLKKYFNKQISRTEMYFIINLENQFSIEQLRSRVVLDWLMLEKISELHSFVRNNQSYSLNKMGDVFLINTPRLWFQFEKEIKKETILNFMNQHLKQIN